MILRKGNTSDRSKAIALINDLSLNKDWRMDLKQYLKKRSIQQNRYYFGVVIKMIVDETGNDSNDIHEYLLGESQGWEEYQVMEKTKVRPCRRSCDMSTKEFGAFAMEWCPAWAASELGMVIPPPEDAYSAGLMDSYS